MEQWNENGQNNMNQNQQSYQNPYGNAPYGNAPYGNQQPYGQPDFNDKDAGLDKTPMTMGEWLLTILALMIPCAGIILYFVWAFGSHGNINRRNYCRASLIVTGIVILIYIVVIVIFGAAVAGLVDGVY